MKCQNCGKNVANVRYLQIINGKKTKLYLCEECANEMNIGCDFNFVVNNFFSDFFEDFMEPSLLTIPSIMSHENLLSDFNRLNNVSVFENSHDYFNDELDETLSRIQKKSAHAFKTKKAKKEISEVEQLKNELNECIKKEEYEKAAVLRDKIKKLEK